MAVTWLMTSLQGKTVIYESGNEFYRKKKFEYKNMINVLGPMQMWLACFEFRHNLGDIKGIILSRDLFHEISP
jgi:hypothetical protein